mgnify:CR=1 FL=1
MIVDKMLRNQSFLAEDYSIKQKLQGISLFKINNHLSRKPNELLFMSKEDFKKIDQNRDVHGIKQRIKRGLKSTLIYSVAFNRITERQDKMKSTDNDK